MNVVAVSRPSGRDVDQNKKSGSVSTAKISAPRNWTINAVM
jgi:hypothetical protein